MTNLNQNYIATSINQFPSKDNNFTAIVEAELSSSDCKSKTFGIATGNDKSNFKNLIDEANKVALENVQNMTASITTHNRQNYTEKTDNSLANDRHFSSVETNNQFAPKTYNHSINKSISEGQINYLKSMTKSQDILEQDVSKRFNKSIAELNSFEANELINHYKNKKQGR